MEAADNVLFTIWIHFVFIATFGNTSPSNIRDIILRVSQMHYGFKEYRVCVEIIVSFRVQMFFYVTSVWLKSIMSLHQVLFVGFPMRVKQHNLSAYS